MHRRHHRDTAATTEKSVVVVDVTANDSDVDANDILSVTSRLRCLDACR